MAVEGYTSRNMKRIAALLVLLLGTATAAEDLTVGTYNIENFRQHFLAHRLQQSKPDWLPRDNPQVKELLDEVRYQNDEDNWEVSQVILDPKFFPDVLVIQEGCAKSDLEFFKQRWLQSKYETAIVFPSNTERDQHLCMLLKPGFTVVEKKDQYHLEKDPVPNDRGDRLFARGPAFVLLQSPSGYRFWVGTNHQKSKNGDSAEVTAWRNREAKRTHEIIKELEKKGPEDVLFLGDMNDELGIQQYELEGGGDVIGNLVGPSEDGLILATKPLAESGQITFSGYWRTDRRSFIDHVIVTSGMKDQLQKVEVVQTEFTRVASDHLPVLVRLQADPAPSATTSPGR